MKLTDIPKNRRIELKGAYNFRDIGGYITSDGQKTNWGKLYRSDNLSKLTKADVKRIEKLNVQLIIDLRSKEECLLKPNRLPSGNGIEIKNLSLSDNNKTSKALIRAILYGKLKGLGEVDIEKEIFNAYRDGVTNYQYELRSLFKLLLNPANYPTIVLCQAGKDRTGVAIALILMALGVAKETILKDYMLSKIYLKSFLTRTTLKARLLSFFRADIAQLNKLLDTRVEYLNTAFKMINQKFGSSEAYLDTVGMDRDKRQLLKNILCS